MTDPSPIKRRAFMAGGAAFLAGAIARVQQQDAQAVGELILNTANSASATTTVIGGGFTPQWNFQQFGGGVISAHAASLSASPPRIAIRGATSFSSTIPALGNVTHIAVAGQTDHGIAICGFAQFGDAGKFEAPQGTALDASGALISLRATDPGNPSATSGAFFSSSLLGLDAPTAIISAGSNVQIGAGDEVSLFANQITTQAGTEWTLDIQGVPTLTATSPGGTREIAIDANVSITGNLGVSGTFPGSGGGTGNEVEFFRIINLDDDTTALVVEQPLTSALPAIDVTGDSALRGGVQVFAPGESTPGLTLASTPSLSALTATSSLDMSAPFTMTFRAQELDVNADVLSTTGGTWTLDLQDDIDVTADRYAGNVNAWMLNIRDVADTPAVAVTKSPANTADLFFAGNSRFTTTDPTRPGIRILGSPSLPALNVVTSTAVMAETADGIAAHFVSHVAGQQPTLEVANLAGNVAGRFRGNLVVDGSIITTQPIQAPGGGAGDPTSLTILNPDPDVTAVLIDQQAGGNSALDVTGTSDFRGGVNIFAPDALDPEFSIAAIPGVANVTVTGWGSISAGSRLTLRAPEIEQSFDTLTIQGLDSSVPLLTFHTRGSGVVQVAPPVELAGGTIRAGTSVANLEIDTDRDVAVAAASPGIGVLGANSMAGLGAITVTASFGVAGANLAPSETLLNVALPAAGAGVLALATDRIALQAFNNSLTEPTATLENRGGGPVLMTDGAVTVGSLTADTLTVALLDVGSQTFESLTVQGITPLRTALTVGHDDPDSIAVLFTGGRMVGALAAGDLNVDEDFEVVAGQQIRFTSATGSEWRVTQANTPALTALDRLDVRDSNANAGMTILATEAETTLSFDNNVNWQFDDDVDFDVAGTATISVGAVRFDTSTLTRFDSPRFEFVGTDTDPDTLVVFFKHPTQGRVAEFDGSVLVSRDLTVLGTLNATDVEFTPATLTLLGATDEVTLTVNQSDPSLAGFLQDGGRFEATNSSVRFTTTEGANISIDNASFAALTLGGAPGGFSLEASGDAAISNGNLTIADGNLTLDTGNVEISTGNLSVAGNGTVDGDFTVGGTLFATVDVDLDTLFLNGEAGETTLTVVQSDAGITAIKQEGGRTELFSSAVVVTTDEGASMSTANPAASNLTLSHDAGGFALDIPTGKVRFPGGSALVPKKTKDFVITDSRITSQTVPLIMFMTDPKGDRVEWFEVPEPGTGIIHFNNKLNKDSLIKWILIEDP